MSRAWNGDIGQDMNSVRKRDGSADGLVSISAGKSCGANSKSEPDDNGNAD